MVILLRLLAAHLITDFLLQPKSWIIDRKDNLHKSSYLYLHGLVTGLVAYLFLGKWGNFEVPVFIMVTHVLIDLWKSHHVSNTKYFVIDQVMHGIILVLSWLYISDQFQAVPVFLQTYSSSIKLWSLLIGYIAVIWPANYLIAFATEKWRSLVQNEGLKDAGRLIGQLERVLILTFVLTNQFAAIGFLIAAKSIFRYNDMQKERKEAEYILTGTLLSFAFSIILGLIITAIIGDLKLN